MTNNPQNETPLPPTSKAVAVAIVEKIQDTAAVSICDLDIVRKRFIQNYNLCHKEQVGDLMYARQQMYFKQLISSSQALQKADKVSIYACFLTLSAKGWSLDPNDNEVYVIPRGGKATLSPQAGAYVKRLSLTEQIQYAHQVQLVFEGDDFVVKMGRVVDHTEKFQSEKIIAAYVVFVIDGKGNEKHFIYRKSDWESWRAKSDQKDGNNWKQGEFNQPGPGFLRTKVMLHACKEKGWAIGNTPPGAEQFEDVIVEDDSDGFGTQTNEPPIKPVVQTPVNTNTNNATPKQQTPENVEEVDDDSLLEDKNKTEETPGVVIDIEDDPDAF